MAIVSKIVKADFGGIANHPFRISVSDLDYAAAPFNVAADVGLTDPSGDELKLPLIPKEVLFKHRILSTVYVYYTKSGVKKVQSVVVKSGSPVSATAIAANTAFRGGTIDALSLNRGKRVSAI